MAALALPALILGTATQAVGGLMAAGERSAAAEFEGQQYQIKAQQLRTAAARDEATKRQNLSDSIGTIMAIRAGRNVGLSSPTGGAVLEDLTRRGESDILTSRTNILTQAEQASQAATMSERKARMALVAGDLGAISTVSSAAFKYATLGV